MASYHRAENQPNYDTLTAKVNKFSEIATGAPVPTNIQTETEFQQALIENLENAVFNLFGKLDPILMPMDVESNDKHLFDEVVSPYRLRLVENNQRIKHLTNKIDIIRERVDLNG